ncbi:hypothetical protein [Winogradskyella sediminis]|jgi:hypothetical protein|uniref:hypothetical protein n=1 Tax=Winogradskyella sediminis TaxID=1382466 RepID=UPI003AA8A43C
MKKIYLLALLIAITSCGNNSELENQIGELQHRNDSLTKILDEYQAKYVYERVFIKHYKTNSEPKKIGNLYQGEFVFVPDVRNDKVEFVAESIRKNEKSELRSVVLETKSGNYGAYPFEFTIESDTTRVYFKPIIRDSLSLRNQNVGYDGTTITDIIIAN